VNVFGSGLPAESGIEPRRHAVHLERLQHERDGEVPWLFQPVSYLDDASFNSRTGWSQQLVRDAYGLAEFGRNDVSGGRGVRIDRRR
jgi:hypothetical protein